MEKSLNEIARTGRQPEGLLVLRTLAMPRDCNANGDIFGGWILSQMDMGGGLLAKEVARSRVVTITIDKMTFVKPVKVGDTVCVYARVVKLGNTSMEIGLEVWTKDLIEQFDGQRHMVTEGIFKYVAIDAERRPRPLPQKPVLPPESLAV